MLINLKKVVQPDCKQHILDISFEINFISSFLSNRRDKKSCNSVYKLNPKRRNFYFNGKKGEPKEEEVINSET